MVQIDGNLDEALNMFIKQVENSSSKLTTTDKQEIALAGAQVFEKAERDETNAKHRSSHHDDTYGHAADGIGLYQPSGLDDAETLVGSYVVGWKERYHAMNMMRVNDGTSWIVGDHFITNLRKNANVQQRMLAAEKAAYDRIVARKRDDVDARG